MFITNFIKILLLFSNIVRSSDIFNDAYKQSISEDRVVREIIKYNHLPEASIPVAIVYDDDSDREEKSIDHQVSKSNVNLKSNKKTSDTVNPTIIRVKGDFSVKSDKADKVKDDPEITVTTEKDNYIPVVVIYEEEPTTVKIHGKGQRHSKIRKQNQFNRHRLDKVEQIVSSKKPVTISDAQDNKSIITTTEKLSETEKPKKAVITSNSNVQKESREHDPVVPILQSENKVFGHSGDFRYSYEGGDGTQVFETGELKSYGDDKKGEAVSGGFSYTDKDGQDFSLSYTADENGYRPVGAHLPTPPPIPPAIERALRYLATKSTPEPVTDSITN